MISYVTLGSNDRAKAKAFYDAALAPLGLTATYADDEMVGYGPEGGQSQLWVVEPFDGLAARASMAPAAGGHDEGRPGLRERYGPNFYAAYLRDPDGNKLAIVCRTPE